MAEKTERERLEEFTAHMRYFDALLDVPFTSQRGDTKTLRETKSKVADVTFADVWRELVDVGFGPVAFPAPSPAIPGSGQSL